MELEVEKNARSDNCKLNSNGIGEAQNACNFFRLHFSSFMFQIEKDIKTLQKIINILCCFAFVIS